MASLSQDSAVDIAGRIMVMREREQERLTRISRYVKGDHDSVYEPRGAKTEYQWIKDRSRVNYLPLIISVISENLHVDGYRPTPPPQQKPTGTIKIQPSMPPQDGSPAGAGERCERAAGNPGAPAPRSQPRPFRLA
jgi:hypothetical protein